MISLARHHRTTGQLTATWVCPGCEMINTRNIRLNAEDNEVINDDTTLEVKCLCQHCLDVNEVLL